MISFLSIIIGKIIWDCLTVLIITLRMIKVLSFSYETWYGLRWGLQKWGNRNRWMWWCGVHLILSSYFCHFLYFWCKVNNKLIYVLLCLNAIFAKLWHYSFYVSKHHYVKWNKYITMCFFLLLVNPLII